MHNFEFGVVADDSRVDIGSLYALGKVDGEHTVLVCGSEIHMVLLADGFVDIIGQFALGLSHVDQYLLLFRIDQNMVAEGEYYLPALRAIRQPVIIYVQILFFQWNWKLVCD